MSETKHTPGPWSADDESANSITIRAASKSAHKLGQEVASVVNDEGFKLTPTMWANARLIAAAPDLYAALSSMTDQMQQFSDAEHVLGCEHLIKAARAALALAESNN